MMLIWNYLIGRQQRYVHEPPHDKINKLTYVPSKDSDQPGHLCSLIRIFAVCMKKARVLSYLLCAERRLIRLGGCPGWSESSLGTQSFYKRCHEAANMFYCKSPNYWDTWSNCCNELAHEIMVLITQATSEGSGEPAHPRSLARAFAIRAHEVWK